MLQWDKIIDHHGITTGEVFIRTSDGGYAYAFSTFCSTKFWLIKINELGAIDWVQNYYFNDCRDLIDMKQTSDSGFLLILNTLSSFMDESERFVVVTINSEGIRQWLKSYDLSMPLNFEAIQINDSGFLADTILVTTGNNCPEGRSCDHLCGITPDGTVIWKKNIGLKRIQGLIQNIDGNFVLAGSQEFHYGHEQYYVGQIYLWRYTSFLMILDQGGNILYENMFCDPTDDDWITQVISTSDGGFTLLGYTTSIGNGKIDGIILKCDKDGDIEWNTIIGGTGDDCVTSIIQNNDGEFILAGLTDPFLQFAHNDYCYGGGCMPPQINSNSTAWLVQINNNGDVQWNLTYSEFSWIDSILQTKSEGSVFIGFTKNETLFIKKTDRSGKLEWMKRYPLVQLNVRNVKKLKCSCGIQTADDSFLVGISALPSFDEDLIILKFDAIGDLEWNFTPNIKRNSYYAVDEIFEIADGFIIIGRYHLELGWKGMNPYGPDYPFMLKIDQDGNSVWNITYKSTTVDGMCHNSLTNLILGSKIASIVTQEHDYLLARDNWVFKINQQGKIQWNQTYNGDILSLCQIDDGTIILTGYNQDTHIDDPSHQIWIAKIDKSGSLLWERTVELKGSKSDLELQFENSQTTQSDQVTFHHSLHNLFFLALLAYYKKCKKLRSEML